LSTPFQNRLVGTIIVAAVAIIVLPGLLDGNKKTYQDEFEQIPPLPKVNFVKTTRHFPQEKLAKVNKQVLSDDAALDDSLITLEAKPKDLEAKPKDLEAKPKDNAFNTKENLQVNRLRKTEAIKAESSQVKNSTNSLPEKSVLKQAWVVQLGSFRHKKNVAQLLLKLKDNGYTAFTKPIKTKNGTLIKVFIGPELIKNSLEKKITALKKLTGVQGKIARFYPTK
jgi:DedD protein